MIIAIDLGSSSLRIIAYDCALKRITQEYESTVKTAESLIEDGTISNEAIDRIITALKHASKEFDFANSSVLAVTTEAMRQAHNAKEALTLIEQKTGVKFKIISAEDEATYTALGVSNRLLLLGMAVESYLLFDLGGASTEIILVKEGKKEAFKSFKLGIVTASTLCSTPKELSTFLKPILDEIAHYINRLYAKEGKPSLFVATAGTPTTMAAYVNGMYYANYDSAKINGYKLHVSACEDVLEALLDMSEQERSFYVGVGREELIIAGIEIVKMLYEVAGFNEAVVIDDGLREGVAISGCY